MQEANDEYGIQTPFTLGIQTQGQKEVMLQYGNNGAFSMDSTFGTNDKKLHLYTIMVFDSHFNGQPVAWVLTSRHKEGDLVEWMRALRSHMEATNLCWKSSCFIVDDAQAERNALR